MTVNALLAGIGAIFGSMFALEVLAVLVRPGTMGLVAAVVGPAASVGTRGHGGSQGDRLRAGVMVVVAGSTLSFLVGGPLLALLIALAGPVASAWFIRLRRDRWRGAMEDGAASSARAIGDAAAAGLPAAAAIERASNDGSVPGAVAEELKDLAVRCRLGLSLEEGLEELRRRAGSQAWEAIVAAVRVQREVGGDLAAILHALAGGLEGSARARSEARSLSSQARLTAWIVVGLPVIGLFLAEVASPGTIAGILSKPLPRLLAALAFILQATAAFVVRRIARLGEPTR